VLVTTGAGVAVPFAWLSRLYGTRVVYVESFTRIDSVSLSCRLISPFTERVYVQWPEALQLVRHARYVGNVFTDSG
jgi:UDP-N-acetylglucosamine:LPS N-acetylglucosamine transferase